MDDVSPKPNLTNAAWIKIPTTLDIIVLKDFCLHVERLLRLNPYLHFDCWEQLNRNIIKAKWKNHSNIKIFSVDTELHLNFEEQEIKVSYLSGIKIETYFMIEPSEQGSTLIIVDNYGENSEQYLDEVDKSLQAWGSSLKRFFDHYRLLNKIPGIDNVIDHFWIRLSPIARRITYILLVITTVEIIALLLFILFVLLL